MKNLEFKVIEKEKLPIILPLVQKLNPTLSKEILSQRLQEMIPQGYQCLGVFDQERLIGVCGFWIQTRLYCGKWIEPDNVFIDPDYQSKGIGKKLMEWIYNHGRSLGCVVSELNCYVTNKDGHRFWMNEGFKILGFHFQRDLEPLKSESK